MVGFLYRYVAKVLLFSIFQYFFWIKAEIRDRLREITVLSFLFFIHRSLVWTLNKTTRLIKVIKLLFTSDPILLESKALKLWLEKTSLRLFFGRKNVKKFYLVLKILKTMWGVINLTIPAVKIWPTFGLISIP